VRLFRAAVMGIGRVTVFAVLHALLHQKVNHQAVRIVHREDARI
jgi:hypothetical protein